MDSQESGYRKTIKVLLAAVSLFFLYEIFTGIKIFLIDNNISYLLNPGTSLVDTIRSCAWSPVKFFIFSGNVFDNLVYFSHLLPIGVMVSAALMFFFRERSQLRSKVFLTLTALFFVWAFSDLILWAHNIPNVIMFFWSLMAPVEAVLFLCFFYYIYIDVEERTEINYQLLLNLILPIVPVFLLWTTRHNLQYFDLTNCDREAKEGWLFIYIYGYEFVLFLLGIFYTIRKFLNVKKVKKVLSSMLLLLVMLSMTGGSLVSSLTDNWKIAQYGLLLIPVFVLVIILLYISEQSEDKKYIGIQLSGTLLVFLICALYLVNNYNQYLFQILTVVILGYILLIGTQIFKAVRVMYQLQSDLRLLDQQKNEFLSFATHQLKAPLTAMKWGMETLRESGDTADDIEQKKVITDKLYDTTNDLIRTVTDLLDISKIEQGGLVIKTEPVVWVEYVQRIAEEFRITASKKGLAFNVVMPSDQSRVAVDTTKIRQVLVNIIDNAIKYTPTGSVTVSVEVVGMYVITKISDTGPGIDQSELGNLFNKFSRGAAGKSAGTAGSGLGLFLAKKIMEMHSGDVWAESAGVGHGSSFVIKLPILSEVGDKITT